MLGDRLTLCCEYATGGDGGNRAGRVSAPSDLWVSVLCCARKDGWCIDKVKECDGAGRDYKMTFGMYRFSGVRITKDFEAA